MNRWQSFVRSLKARHVRHATENAGAELTFRRASFVGRVVLGQRALLRSVRVHLRLVSFVEARARFAAPRAASGRQHGPAATQRPATGPVGTLRETLARTAVPRTTTFTPAPPRALRVTTSEGRRHGSQETAAGPARGPVFVSPLAAPRRPRVKDEASARRAAVSLRGAGELVARLRGQGARETPRATEVTRVFARAQRDEAARPNPSPEPRALDAESAAARRAAPPTAAVDVDALTDKVIKQLDRRLVTHRERMGRV